MRCAPPLLSIHDDEHLPEALGGIDALIARPALI